ncbi:MAG: hypothetical protein MJ137_07230, partial [Clostridia bacterium]|nr:hypothetical protein [Clostridia bacterium]
AVDANVKVEYTVEKVTTPKAGTAYVFGLTQKNLGSDLYFAGAMSGNYLATTDKISKAATVYLEADGENFRLYFEKDGAKNYVEIYEYTSGKAGIQIVAAPTMSYTYNAEMGVLIANVAGSDRYLGTYNNFNTISASATSYITGANAANVGVTQFPAYLFTATAK